MRRHHRPAGTVSSVALTSPAHIPATTTYPSFAAALFSLGANAPSRYLQAVITTASVCALATMCRLSLGAAGVWARPETVFAAAALALLIAPVGDMLHLGEVDLIVAAPVAVDQA